MERQLRLRVGFSSWCRALKMLRPEAWIWSVFNLHNSFCKNVEEDGLMLCKNIKKKRKRKTWLRRRIQNRGVLVSILVRSVANVNGLEKGIVCQGSLWKLLLLPPKQTVGFILIVRVTTSHQTSSCLLFCFCAEVMGCLFKNKNHNRCTER